MQNFQYYAPTNVVFGRDTEEQTGALVRRYGGTKVLVHFGGGSARSSGLLDRVEQSLTAAGLPFVELGGVVPNPRLSKVYEGVELCRRTGVDFLLAVGGGSVIDSAKAIGYGLSHSCDVWELFEGTQPITGCTPVGTVLTIAAAGSEMSNSCVITNEEGQKKRGIHSDLCRCRFAVMNPTLTFTLPPWQTAAGCVDILSHTFERYFAGDGRVEPTDSVAEGLMRSMLALSRRVMTSPTDYEARAGILWAGSLSQNNLTGCGHGGNGRVGDWASHQLEHELGGLFDVTHGAGLAALWASWARYVMAADYDRFAQFAVNVMGVTPCPSPADTAEAGVAAFEAFLRELGMPTSIHALGIELDEQTIDTLSWKCTFQGKRTIGSFRPLGLEEIRAIYRLAR